MVSAKAANKTSVSELPAPSRHQRIIGALKKPYWMVNESPLDNVWVIRKEAGRKRAGDMTVLFDRPIAPGIRSVDLEDDLITAKLLAYNGLSGIDARYDSGATIPINGRSYFSYVRWRHARGINSNADLTRDDIIDLLQDLKANGIVGLAPYEERLEELAERIDAGKFEIPFYTKGKRRFARKSALAEALGAPHTKSLPPSVSHRLDELAESHGFAINPRKQSDHDAEEDRADEAALSENRLISFLTIVQLLYYYRKHLKHDQICFEPFEGESKIAEIAKSIARVFATRTFTTPTYQACFLVDQSITWVTTYFDEIKSFTEELDTTIQRFRSEGHWRPTEAAFKERLRLDQGRYTSAPGSWWPVHPSYWASPGWVSSVETSRPSLRPVLFELLATAALVVIAAFSARRKEEMGSLKDNCIQEVDGELWLETWISKNVRDLDKIPVPVTVKKAVDVLLWLSKSGRAASGAGWLLDFAEFFTIGEDPKPGNPRYDFYTGLDRFANFVGVPLIAGQRWIPKPAEYRRFFGMTYFHRFDYANLVALSDFYRHFNPTRTRGYLTEIGYGLVVRRREENAERAVRADRRIARFAADRLDDFEECGLEYRISVLQDAITGAGYMTGFGGTTIVNDAKKLIRDYKAQMNIGPDNDLNGPTLNHVLRRMVGPMSIDPHPNGHSGCKCTGKVQDLATASCLRLRAEAYPEAPPPNRPDIEFATDLTCAGCVHNVQLPCHRRWWDNALEHEAHQSNHALMPFLQEVARGRAEEIDAVLTRCHGHPRGDDYA